MKRQLPIWIAGLTGFIYIIAGFLQIPFLVVTKNELDKWYLIATAFAMLTGLINLISIHSGNIRRRKPGSHNSAILLVSLLVVLVVGLLETDQGPNFTWIFKYVLTSLTGTMYSLLCFYIASAAYRAFRIRSIDSALLLLTAIVIMLGNVPIGDAIWEGMPAVGAWLLDVPNAAGMRGILIGGTLGGIATALRIVLGIERGYLGRAD